LTPSNPPPTSGSLTVQEEVISKTNEIINVNTVPIFVPNPNVPQVPAMLPLMYDDNSYDDNSYDYNDYPEYNPGVDPGFDEPPPFAIPTISTTTGVFLDDIDDQDSLPTLSPPVIALPPPRYEYYAPEPEFVEVLPPTAIPTLLDDPNLECYERTCDQNITGTYCYNCINFTSHFSSSF
jgi:hypothetical protein